MPVYQTIAHFEHNGRGWSESWYRDSGGVTSLDANIDFDIQQLWIPRAKLLAGGAANPTLRYVRASWWNDGKRAARPREVNLVGPSQPAFESAQPEIAVMARFYDAGDTSVKLVYLRGVPDLVEQQGGKLIFGGDLTPWAAAYTAYAGQILGRQYGWLSTRNIVPDGVPDGWYRCVNYAPYAEGDGRKIAVALDPQFPALPDAVIGKKIRVRFRGAGGCCPSRLNGEQIVVPVAPRTVVVFRELALLPFDGTPFEMARLTQEHTVATGQQIWRVTTRKTGLPFAVPPGRVPAVPRG